MIHQQQVCVESLNLRHNLLTVSLLKLSQQPQEVGGGNSLIVNPVGEGDVPVLSSLLLQFLEDEEMHNSGQVFGVTMAIVAELGDWKVYLGRYFVG